MPSPKEFAHLLIPLQEVEKATKKFAKENLIGKGGFGKVYKGNLIWKGQSKNIAARRLHHDYGQGDIEFWTEIMMLNSLKHENIVSIVGFCDENDEKIIINEHEANGSLDKYLSGSTLTWVQRLEICVGVAHALKYIHYDDRRDFSVIHRNIKSSKILLDDNLRPKLSGFEISMKNTKARRHRLLLSKVIIGTIGYVDPTYEKTGFVSHKSDVFSLGVVLFEVLCGRRAFMTITDEQVIGDNVPRKQLSPSKWASTKRCLSDFTKEFPLILSKVLCGRRGFMITSDKIDLQVSTEKNKKQGNMDEMAVSHDIPTKLPEQTQPPLSLDDNTALPSVQVRQPAASNEVKPVLSADRHMGKPFGHLGPLPPINGDRPMLFLHEDAMLSSAQVRQPAQKLVLSFNEEQPSSFTNVKPSSFSSLKLPSFHDTPLSSNNMKPFLPTDIAPIESFSSNQSFTKNPLFTMKRLGEYSHSPNEELLAQLAKLHYEADLDDLDDLIDQGLRKQMNQQSFEIFSETAYTCINEQRARRPNIDQIIQRLEKALNLQRRHELLKDTVEVEGRLSNHLKRKHLGHLKFALDDIKSATNSFSETCLIGTGGYGNVYKAELYLPREEKRKTVAIKRILVREDKNGEEGFDAEVDLLTSCKHPNIVYLHGFCVEGSHMILVYDHVSNGSLDDHLGSSEKLTNLSWVQRLKICIDIAQGLHYLHSRKDDERRIIHRDIKSGNILLGKNWEAKIADFGLSRFHHDEDQQADTVYTENIVGTRVYLDPEYEKKGKLKKETDIYSFGVVLFEVLFGRLAYDPIYTEEDEKGLAPVARRHFEEGTINEMVDPKIMEEVDELVSYLCKGPNIDSLNTFINIAYQCVAETQDERPTSKSIIEELEKALRFQESHKDNLQMSLDDIKMATQNFNPRNLIGGGGFGKVYEGQVTHANGSNTIVAKRLDKSQGQGEHEFLTELEILFEHKHENVIGLVGYCNEKDERIIVYEHAPKISLDKHLGDISLSWMQRLKICVDVVRGLDFLHHGTPTKDVVIHRDIKSANILLTHDWKAKISDFGLSLISPSNEEEYVISKLVGTISYVDPLYESTGFLTKESDIYSLGVVLFEIFYGELLVRNKRHYYPHFVTMTLNQIHDEGKFGRIALIGMKKQIAPDSLSTFRMIVRRCLDYDRIKRPTTKEVLQQLNKAVELQEDYEIWQPKLPKDYEDLIQTSKSPEIYSTQKNKDLYNMFSKGILLQNDNVWFLIGNHGERNEMISARKSSYIDRSPHVWRSISESRFQEVAEMLDVSNLMIKIKTRTHFLSPNVVYGVHLVFKFCDSRIVPSKPMYVNLKYKKGTETLHAYFAIWRDDEWMMIELHRFFNHGNETIFEFMLESLSPYYCGDGSLYVEGIEFRAIQDVKHEEMEELNRVQRVLKSNLNVDQVQQSLTNYGEGEQLYSLSGISGRKHLMLSAKAALYDFSNEKLFISKPSVEPRFQEVVELLPQQVFLINCKIEARMLSPDTDYICYLVFNLSEQTHGLRCPLKVRNMLNQKEEEAEVIYFVSPRPWNRHDITQVPKQREDGLMEVSVWKFNSDHHLTNDSLLVNLKLISYEGSMAGLVVYGLEFRPM